MMTPPDIATIQSLRVDLALQITRHLARRGESQVEAARALRIPQPTLSKIVNGKLSGLSLELLIRIAVRAGLPVVLQTGQSPEEAGAFTSGASRLQSAERGPRRSSVAEEAREALRESARRLSPEQRLEAFLKHSELVMGLREAGRRIETPRGRQR